MSIFLDFFGCDANSNIDIPYSEDGVSAGIPFHIEDSCDMSLDLNKELIKNRAATFFARVKGCSMIDAGIDDGDLIIVDKLVEPYDNCIAVCFIDGEFTLKRVKFKDDHLLLVAENKNYKPIKVTKDNEFTIWGVVRYSIKKL